MLSFKFRSTVIIASVTCAVLAAPNSETPTSVSASITTRPALGPCDMFPTGGLSIGPDGTTTTMAPTIYATWAPTPSEIYIAPTAVPANGTIIDGTYLAPSAIPTNGTFVHPGSALTYTSTRGSAGWYIAPTAVPSNGTVIDGTFIAPTAIPTNGTVFHPAPTYWGSVNGTNVTATATATAGQNATGSVTITTMWPDATNGGVWTTVNETITGWAWPTACPINPNVTQGGPPEGLKSEGENGAGATLAGSISALTLGGVAAAAVVLAL